jgi:hypothetical protein
MNRYIAAFFIIVFSSFASFCKGQDVKDTIDNTYPQYVLLIYGMPSGGVYLTAKRVVAERWGIQFIRVGDCVVSRGTRDSASANNSIVNKKLEEKYGIGWRKEFNKQVDKEYKRQEKIIRFVNSEKIVKNKQAEMSDKGGLDYEFQPIEGTTEYYVWVNGWVAFNNEVDWGSYYTFRVNYKTKKVVLLSDVPERRKHPALYND